MGFYVDTRGTDFGLQLDRDLTPSTPNVSVTDTHQDHTTEDRTTEDTNGTSNIYSTAFGHPRTVHSVHTNNPDSEVRWGNRAPSEGWGGGWTGPTSTDTKMCDTRSPWAIRAATRDSPPQT